MTLNDCRVSITKMEYHQQASALQISPTVRVTTVPNEDIVLK